MSKEEMIEKIRQDFWYYLSENPETITSIARDMRMDRMTLSRFAYGESVPDSRTVMRVKQFIKERYEQRDREHQKSLSAKNQEV